MSAPDLPPPFVPLYGDERRQWADQMRAYGDARAAAAVLAEWEKSEAMRADAERYRWLRDKCFLWDISWQWPQVIFPAVGATDDSNESLEVAIDAAMEHAENSVRDALFAPKEQQPCDRY